MFLLTFLLHIMPKLLGTTYQYLHPFNVMVLTCRCSVVFTLQISCGKYRRRKWVSHKQPHNTVQWHHLFLLRTHLCWTRVSLSLYSPSERSFSATERPVNEVWSFLFINEMEKLTKTIASGSFMYFLNMHAVKHLNTSLKLYISKNVFW